jgi:hypothetical protein
VIKNVLGNKKTLYRIIAAGFIILALFLFIPHHPEKLEPKGKYAELIKDGVLYRVDHVLDGDTFVANVSGKPTQGGSTLTQQLIKSSLLTSERSVQRKVKEIVLAFVTEILYSKSQILEMYLNQIPYGGTAYGIEAASKTYFGKSAKDLTLAESALLPLATS